MPYKECSPASLSASQLRSPIIPSYSFAKNAARHVPFKACPIVARVKTYRKKYIPAHAVGVSLLNVLENLTGGRLVGSNTIEHRLCKI